jgi:hypothetical protein
MLARRARRLACAALAAIAVAAPAVGARPVEPPGDARSQAVTPSAPTVMRTIDPGFDWGAAAIGAGGATALFLLVVAVATALARRHHGIGI